VGGKCTLLQRHSGLELWRGPSLLVRCCNSRPVEPRARRIRRARANSRARGSMTRGPRLPGAEFLLSVGTVKDGVVVLVLTARKFRSVFVGCVRFPLDLLIARSWRSFGNKFQRTWRSFLECLIRVKKILRSHAGFLESEILFSFFARGKQSRENACRKLTRHVLR
jgi:hypothetical protein